MILEVAEIHIENGKQAQYEAAVKQGMAEVVSKTNGFISYELRRSIEETTRYLLLIQWETLEAHTINFRESDNFPKWRAIVGGYFVKPPHVQHFELCE